MSDQSQQQPTEDELRAAYEAQLKQLRVEDVLIQTIVSLINLGGRRAGLAPGTEDEHDPEQLRLAIEGVRGLLPLVEAGLGPDAAAIRDALSQLQLAYTRAPAPGAPAPTEPPASGGIATPPPSKLWVPGQ